MASTIFEETVGHLSALLPNINLLYVDVNGHGRTTAGRKTFTLWERGDDVIALMVRPHPHPRELLFQPPLVKHSNTTIAHPNTPSAECTQNQQSHHRRHLNGRLRRLRMALAHASRITALILLASAASVFARRNSRTQLRPRCLDLHSLAIGRDHRQIYTCV
jgi:hypothetical protein